MKDDPQALRLRVVSGDPLARGGLAALLERLGFAVDAGGSGAAGSADVAVWDLGAAGEPPAIRMSADEPVLALYADPAEARRALARGASGVLPRDTATDRLAAAVRALAADLVVLDDSVAAELLPASEEGLLEPLTAREAEVLLLLAEGLSNGDIGEALAISSHTARFHVRAILAKLGARNRAEAVGIAARLGLLGV